MFAQTLKQAMIEKGVTQSELSKLSGIGKPSISGYVNGNVVPGKKHREKLAAVLGVTVDFLDGKTQNSDTVDDLKTITVGQCAKLLGKSRQFVRISLQQGAAPFGFAVKGAGEKYSYHISEKKLNEYIGKVTA